MGVPRETVSADYLTETAKVLNTDIPSLAAAFGLNPSTLYKWQRSGRMPTIVRTACEGLRRRNKAQVTENETIVLRGPRDMIKIVENLAHILNLEVASWSKTMTWAKKD